MYIFIYCREHILLEMLHHVLTALQGSLVHQLTILLFLVVTEPIPWDYKLPVLYALQAWPVHQPQQPLPMIVQLEPTVLEDKMNVLYALRDMPVHQHTQMMLFYVEKGPMHLVTLTGVLHVLQVSTVPILPLLLFHVLRATTAQHVLYHVHHALRDTVALTPACHQCSAKLVTIAMDMLQSVQLVNQVRGIYSLFVFTEVSLKTSNVEWVNILTLYCQEYIIMEVFLRTFQVLIFFLVPACISYWTSHYWYCTCTILFNTHPKVGA